MIIDMRPLTLAEAKEIAGDLEEKKELKDYFKKFAKEKKENSEKVADAVRKLENLKIKEENVIKIADFMPKSVEELNLIFNDVSLDEKEINDILDAIHK